MARNQILKVVKASPSNTLEEQALKFNIGISKTTKILFVKT